MINLTLTTPFALFSRLFPSVELAERWGYNQVLNTVQDCNRWKECKLTIDGKDYPMTLQAVTKFRGFRLPCKS